MLPHRICMDSVKVIRERNSIGGNTFVVLLSFCIFVFFILSFLFCLTFLQILRWEARPAIPGIFLSVIGCVVFLLVSYTIIKIKVLVLINISSTYMKTGWVMKPEIVRSREGSHHES